MRRETKRRENRRDFRVRRAFDFREEEDIRFVSFDKDSQSSYCLGLGEPSAVPREQNHCEEGRGKARLLSQNSWVGSSRISKIVMPCVLFAVYECPLFFLAKLLTWMNLRLTRIILSSHRIFVSLLELVVVSGWGRENGEKSSEIWREERWRWSGTFDLGCEMWCRPTMVRALLLVWCESAACLLRSLGLVVIVLDKMGWRGSWGKFWLRCWESSWLGFRVVVSIVGSKEVNGDGLW